MLTNYAKKAIVMLTDYAKKTKMHSPSEEIKKADLVDSKTPTILQEKQDKGTR